MQLWPVGLSGENAAVKRRGNVSIGTVKFWHEEKGWGAISSPDLPDGRDAWAHFSAIEMDGYRALTAGQRVEFRYQARSQDSFDFAADWVKPLA